MYRILLYYKTDIPCNIQPIKGDNGRTISTRLHFILNILTAMFIVATVLSFLLILKQTMKL